MRTKVIHVVGAGMGGLSAAIRLAHAGHRVEVFEEAAYPGGKLWAFEEKGYAFDGGPSLFTLPHLVDELLALGGKNPSEYLQYVRVGEANRYFWDDGTRFTAFFDHDQLAVELKDKLGVDPLPVLNYLRQSADLYQKTTPFFLEKSLHKVATYFSPDVFQALGALSQLGLQETLHRRNEKKLKDPKLVQVFDRFATYNGSNPYQTPGVMMVIPHLEHNEGVYYPMGGMVAIPRALHKKAKELGVVFHFNTRVDSIEVQNGKATGVRANGRVHPADAVVSNMDVVPTYRHLLKDQKAPEHVLKQPRSSSALVFYWGIKREFPEFGLHNILFSNDYQAEFDGLFRTKTMGEDPTVYINITSKLESSMAPAGSENWFVMVNAPHDAGQDWNALLQKTRAAVLKRVQTVTGVSLEPFIEVERTWTPPGIAQQTHSYLGALYGASSNNPFAAFLRHPNFSQRIKGLYFCGGSVHPGGGIPLSLLSGRIVSSLVS